MSRMSVHICTKGRNDCLALLLESLRKQTFKEWDLVLLDNNLGQDKGEPRTEQHFLCQAIFNRLQFEGHRIQIIDNSKDEGPRDIGRYRNMLIDKDEFKDTNKIGCRIDDDSICELNYLEILYGGFQKDSKVAVVGGIVPYYWAQTQHAPMPAKFNEITRFWDWTDNCINFYRMLDPNGRDKHWIETFFESGHVRSSYAYRMDIAREIKFPEWSGATGFVEETVFCAKVWMSGCKILFNPNAICWHTNAPYGGGRDTIKSQEDMDKIKETNLTRLKEELTAFRDVKGLDARSYP